MISWKIRPGNHQPAGERFLKSGAPMLEGLNMIGRWHAPGSAYGWVLVEGDNLRAVYEHAAQWANLLDLETTPILGDADTAQTTTKVYGT